MQGVLLLSRLARSTRQRNTCIRIAHEVYSGCAVHAALIFKIRTLQQEELCVGKAVLSIRLSVVRLSMLLVCSFPSHPLSLQVPLPLQPPATAAAAAAAPAASAAAVTGPSTTCAATTVPPSKPLLLRAEVQDVLQMRSLLIVFLPGAGCLYRPGLECLLACGLQSGKLHWWDYLQSLARKCPVKSKCSAQKYIMGWAYPA